mmetsp:Transcript_27144/g.48699  ORF Transcript_27144/g.48699 Transcript_27144/m.48699 type:complete len:468 (-) Transcript_27144:80-1483(-)
MLNHETSMQTRSKSVVNESEAKRLQRSIDTFTAQLERENRSRVILDNELAELKEALKAKRTAVANRTEIAKKRTREMSKVQMLEVMIEKERRQLNAKRVENSKLRSEIDILRKNKSSYSQANKRMSSETIRLAQKARDFSAEGNRLERSVDYARKEIERLNMSVSMETSNYSTKLSQLESAIIDDRKTKNKFMHDLGVGDTVHEVSEAGQILFRILDHWKQKLKAKHKELDLHVKFTNQLYDGFEAMKSSANTTSIDELLKIYISSYEENRKLMQCVLALTRSIEEVESELEAAQIQIEKMQKTGKMTKEEQAKVIGGMKEELAELREGNKEAIEKAENIKSQFMELRETLEAISAAIAQVGITSIYEVKLPDPDIELDITTARSLLNSIEDKFTTLIMLKSQSEKPELSMLDLQSIPEKKMRTMALPIQVDKNLVTDIDEEASPLTSDQIQAKASRRVMKLTARST